MVGSSQIREQLARFLDGQTDLDRFEDWFIQNTWNIHQSGSEAAEALTFAVEESLSEFSSGHIDERDLREEFSRLIERDTKTLVLSFAPGGFSWKIRSAPAIFFAARL